MDSPISLVIAIFMEHFEKESPQENIQKARRVIDNIFVIWRHGKVKLQVPYFSQ